MSMKKRTRIIWFTIGCVCIVLTPILLVAQFGNDTTNYQEDYISNLKPIETHELNVDKDKSNVTIYKENDRDFTILQLSDVHYVGSHIYRSLDLKALEAVYAMIDYVRPDLVIYTGDIVYPTLALGSNNNIKSARILNKFFKKMEVPFLYQYGNHDTEFYATGDASDLNEIFQANPYCLAKNDVVSSSRRSRLSQVVELRNSDSSLNQALFLLDSGSYANNTSFLSGYASFSDDDVKWYENKLKQLQKKDKLESTSEISSLAFFHIPLYEYKTAEELYKQGSDEVQYLYGQNDEGISCGKPSGMFDKMVELGSTKATFVGHDHINNLALIYKKIGLYWGQSIDYRAYPTIKHKTQYRGGAVITIHDDASFEVRPQLLKDIIKEA